MYEHSGWTPYVGALDVQVVFGDHHSMGLESDLRVLGGKLRAVVEHAESNIRQRTRDVGRAVRR